MVLSVNYNEVDYIKAGAIAYFLCDKMEFVVGGVRFKVATVGTGCGLGPVFVLAGMVVYVGLMPCASFAEANCWHMEGPVRVPDYASYTPLPLGAIFVVKPPWMGHFLSTIGFAPLPLLPCQPSIGSGIGGISGLTDFSNGQNGSIDTSNLNNTGGSGLPQGQGGGDGPECGVSK